MDTRLHQRRRGDTAIFVGVWIAFALLFTSCGGGGGLVTPTSVSTAGVTISGASVTFNNQVVGTTSAPQTITLTNSGSATLNIASVDVTGPNFADFLLTNDCGNSVAPGANCIVSATFTPSATGSRSASVKITDNAAGSPQTVALSGTGIAPAFTPSTASLEFGSQLVGAPSAAQTETVTNSGTANLTISTATIGGANASDFAISKDTCSGSTVISGSTCAVGVTFTPAASGTRSASLFFADNAAGNPQSVSLSGTGSYPQPSLTSLSPSSVIAGAGAQTLTLSGSNFLSTSTVTYNGVAHTPTFVSASELTIALSVADQATAGSYAVVVTNPTPGGGTSSATFAVTNPAPTLTSLSPSTVVAGAAAQTLTLTGSNFLSTSTVTYNGVAHTPTLVTASELTITLSVADQAAAGSYAVVVTNPAPAGGTSSATFAVTNPAPTLTSLSPSSGVAGAAAQILTLSGSNFLSTSTVTYNGVAHTPTFVSASELTITLSVADQATAGRYAVVVTNPTPGGGTSSATFAVSNPAPTLTSLSPSSVVAGA
ncbi:MAG: choice-of-anchor D domain-containing protein, partial [Terriglobia bacterium]